MGTARPGTSTSGPHSAGLLQEMGYPPLPRGGAQRRRDALVRDALQDLRAVVEEAFGGVVAGWLRGQWYSLQTGTEVLSDGLARDVTWFLFLVHDWRDRMTAAIESYHADRHARGETPYQVAVATDRERASPPRGPREGSRAYRHARRRAGPHPVHRPPGTAPPHTEAVGRLFGVSKHTVKKWEKKQTPNPGGRSAARGPVGGGRDTTNSGGPLPPRRSPGEQAGRQEGRPRASHRSRPPSSDTPGE